MTYRIGVIGAGPNASAHAEYFAASSRSQVVAIADPVLEKAQQLAQETGARAFADFRDFLDDVDAVVVSSPNFLHHLHAIAVAQAKKHLYCEKPLGLKLEQAREIEQAVGAAQIASVVGFSPRFSGSLQTLSRLAREGELGQIVSIGSRRLGFIVQSDMPPWRRDHAQSGGLLLEINIHELDWILRTAHESGCGEVQSVYARMWAAEKGERRNDFVWVTIGFEAGATGWHEGSWSASNPSYFREVQGTDAAVATNEWGNEVYTVRPGAGREPHAVDADFDLRAHFLDCIEGAAPVCDVAWGLRVMEVAEAVFESAKTGQVVSFEYSISA